MEGKSLSGCEEEVGRLVPHVDKAPLPLRILRGSSIIQLQVLRLDKS